MKSTMQYSVGGNIIDIADDRLDEFLADAEADGETPEEVFTFYVDGEPVQVLASRVDEFLADCEADGVKPQKRRGIAMDDGTVLNVDPYAFEQIAQARRQGFDVSRSMLKKAGIPEQYAKSREQRNWLAQRFAENFFADQITDEERAKMMGVGEDDIEIDETAGLRAPDAPVEEPDSPALAAIKGFGEGALQGLYDTASAVARPVAKFASDVARGAGNLTTNGIVMPNGIMIGGTGKLGGDYDNPNDVALRRRNNVGNKVGDVVDRFSDSVLFTEESDNPIAKGVNFVAEKASELGKFAASPSGLLALESFGDSWNKNFDEYIKAGRTPEEAAEYADAGGTTGAAFSTLLKAIPVTHFLKKGLGYKEVGNEIKSLVGKIGEGSLDSIKGVVNKAIAKDLLANMAYEATSFGGISGAQAFIDSVIRQKGANDEIDLKQAFMDAKDAFVSGAVEGAVMGGVMSAPRASAAKAAGRVAEGQRRNEVRAEASERGRRLDDQQYMAVENDVAALVPEGDISDIVKRVESKVRDAREMDDPEIRERLINEAIEEKYGKQEDGVERIEKPTVDDADARVEKNAVETVQRNAENAAHAERQGDIEAAFDRDDSMRGQQERAKRKAEMEEYERQEAERKRREAEDEANVPEVGEETARHEEKPVEDAPKSRTEEWPEYAEWLKKNGRDDTDKNWNKFVAENELDPALKAEQKGERAETVEEKPIETVAEEKPFEEQKAESADRTLAKIEESQNILESLRRIASDENVLPNVSDEKLIETLNDERAKDPKYADLIDKVKAELEKRGKLSESHQSSAEEPAPAKTESKSEASVSPAPAESAKISYERDIESARKAIAKPESERTEQEKVHVALEQDEYFSKLNKTFSVKSREELEKVIANFDRVSSARSLLKEKFYQDEKALAAARAKLPPQAAKLREAYDVAIGEAKKRAAQEAEALNQINERLDLNRLDPKRRSDPKVIDWAKKNGRTIADGMVTPDAVREYDAQLAKSAAKAAKKWFPGMEIVTHDYGEKIERGKNVIDIRDTSGNTIGWFDPGKFETHLLPGANAETVAHEIAWHGTRQWAKVEMGHGNAKDKKLFDKMREVEDNCPAMLKAKILKIYGKHYAGRSIDDFYNEYGAWDFMAKGGEALEKAMQKAENRAWYAKWWDAAKNMVKEAFHANKPDMANIDEIDGLTPEQFKDWLADNFAGGKTLAVRDKPKGAAKISTEETAFQKARRKVYDVNAAIRDLQKDIEKKIGRKLTDREDAEMANALSSGKREAAVMDVKSRIEEYRNELSRLGLSDPDVQYYMALKAAAGRDAKVDNRNIENLRKRMKAEGYSDTEIDDAVNNYQSTNGSHIDPREAKKLIAELEGGEKGNAYRQIRDLLRKTIDETLQAQRDAGLISDAQYREWKAEEPDYIPFKNSFDDVTGEFYGRGVNNFTKPEHYTAKGRQSSAGDITTHIFADYQNTLLRGIETDVRQRLARLVEMNPELGTVEKISDMSKLKQKTTRDRIEDGKIADDRSGDPNVIIFKRGGESYAIRLNGTRGSAIAAGITERNTLRLDNMGKLGKAFSAFSRSQAAMATRRSLTFPLRNALKDNIELSNIVFSEKGIVNGTKWVGHYAKGQAANAKALAEYIATGKIDTTTEGGKTLDAYIKAGGLISGGATEGIAKIKSSLTPEAIEKEMKRGLSKTRAVASGTLKAIGFANEYAEMATRLNAFYAERKIGASDERAALFARRATVDFNRHGEWTGVTNVARLFSNSTLGATARATAALAKSKAGMAVAGTMFVNGLAQSLLEYYTNKDADEETRKKGGASGKDVSEYERKTSLFHYRKGDKFYKVAQHESPFSLFNYAGDLMGRTLTGQISAKDAAKNLGVSTAELAYAFTGLGNINVQSREGTIGSDMKAAIVSGAVPSALQPLAEIMLGIDYKGDPLYRTNMSKTKPNSEVSKSHTPDYAKLAAKNLNEIGGGDASTKSWLDVSPETIQKLVEGYGKNAVKDIMEAYETGKAIINGELPKLDDRSVPFKRDFVRPLDGNTSRYYTAYNQFIRDKGTFDGKTSEKSWKDGERKQFLDDHPWLRKVGEKRRIDYLVDNTNKESPRRGVRGMGVDQLRKLVDGKVYLKRGGKYGYYEPNTPLTDEEIEAAKAELQRKQALVIEIMGL